MSKSPQKNGRNRSGKKSRSTSLEIKHSTLQRRRFLKTMGVTLTGAALLPKGLAAAAKKKSLSKQEWLKLVDLKPKGKGGGASAGSSSAWCSYASPIATSCTDYCGPNDAYYLSSVYTPGAAVYGQEHTNWCWIACAVYIANMYGASYSQCNVYNAIEGLSCCGSGYSSDPRRCNRTGALATTLGQVGISAGISGPACWTQVAGYIDTDSYVAVRIKWWGCSAHFVVINGYDCEHGNPMFQIWNPGDNSETLVYPDGGLPWPNDWSGNWTTTYWC